MRRVLSCLFLFTLAGCASGMSKDECLYADWRAIGYEDGARGAPATAISPRRSACAKKAGLAPNMDAYLAGREAGLDQFCRPAKGFDLGAHGGRYDGACAGRDEAGFTAAFAQGRGLYERQAAVNQAADALAAGEADLDRLDHQITSAETALVSPTTPNDQRVSILADLKQMHDDREKTKRVLPRLRRDLDYAQRELGAYQASLAANDLRGVVAPQAVSY